MQSLAIPQQLIVSSDHTIALSVTNQQLALKKPLPIAPKGLTPVPEIAAWPGPVVPGELLHVLGEALTPALPDEEFWLSAQWALYRYAWAFAVPDATLPLRLSEPALQLVDHHRRLASEQLAIACALHVAMWVVAEKHPGFDVDFVDADVALDPSHAAGSGWGLAPVNNARRMRPDYFLMAADPTSDLDHVYALECKGTHYDSNWRQQMKKAASQVRGVNVKGKPPSSLIISAVLAGGAIRVRVLDPPGGDEWSGEADFAEEDALIAEAPDETGSVEVVSAARLRGDLHQISDARRLAYAGQHAAAAETLPERVRSARRDWRPLGNTALETRETPVGDVQAVTATLPLGSGTLEISTGLSRPEIERLRMPAPADRRRDRTTRGETSRDARRRDVASLAEVAGSPDGRDFHSLRDDGTYLALRLR